MGPRGRCVVLLMALAVVPSVASIPAPGQNLPPLADRIAPGRVAVSSDGNYHDLDDILASAMTLAILAKSGNAAKLVHDDYADHVWATDAAREQKMRVSTVDTAALLGGFTRASFVNAVLDPAGAVASLAAAMDASSVVDPLWVIAAGPMEIVGRALAAADASKLRFVHLISHSTWNDQHATSGAGESPAHTCCYTWDRLRTDFPAASFHHIVDQNAGLDRPYSENYWLRDSPDVALRWLWCRGLSSVCPEFGGAAGAGKTTFDDSDAGMAYWLVTGGWLNGKNSTRIGDQHATPEKLRALLAG